MPIHGQPRRLAAAALTGCLLALGAAPAAADVTSGLYIAGGAGANWPMKTDNDDITLTPRAGVVAVGSLGWGFGNGLRLEVEGNYRGSQNSGTVRTANTVSTIGSGPGAVTVTSSAYGQNGRLQTYGAMVNLFYDLRLAELPIMPYVGLGIGVGFAELSGLRQVYSTSYTGRGRVLGSDSLTATTSDTSTRFAYQAIIGAGYSLARWVPGLVLTAEYRFYGTLNPEWSSRAVYSSPLGTDGGSFRVSATNRNNAVLVGLRYNFGVAPPAPPAEPVTEAPAPARTYLVFFDWDRADLTDRARQIIAEAAENSRRVQVTRIELSGHADRSGSADYNMRLSRRRADTVAAELVRQGVARGIITIQAFGESRPLVPTADGVREPQNRRVEIVLR